MKFLVRLLLFTPLLLVASRAAGAAERPNILFILAEDIGAQLSCYGEPLVRTPNLDKIAARGVRFTRAFTTAPVCSTSRSSMMTGMYQTSIGAHQHRTWQWRKQALPEGVRMITDYFRDAGYFTANLGPTPGEGKGKGKKAGKNAGAAAGAPKQTGGAVGSGKTDFNFITDHAPFDGNDWNQRKPGQPFFAEISISETHKGNGWPLSRKSPDRVTPVDPNKVKLAPYYPDHPVARDEYANYLDAIMLMDSYVGDLMARLEKDGLTKNTIVVFIGDNGQCLFRTVSMTAGFSDPLEIAGPHGRRAGEVDAQFVSSIDLSAAMIGMAGATPNPVMQGRNFLAPGATPRTHIFAARDRMEMSTDKMRAVRTDRYKYIRNYYPMIPYMQYNDYKEKQYPTWNLVKTLASEGKLNPVQAQFAAATKPIEELFDLQSDPDEVHNLAADPAHAAKLKELRELVDRWVVETKDQGDKIEDPLDIQRGYGKKEP